MIDIYYPYFEREARWEELRFSLRSMEQNFRTEFRVWIVGDLPAWINPETVHHIPHRRCEGMPENTTYDAITKLLLFINHPDTSIHFVRMYDDIYMLQPVMISDLTTFRAMFDYTDVPPRDGVWWDQLRRTLDAVIRKGYHGWNTETHLPEFFNKERMKWVIDAYDALSRRLLTSTLYFNTYFVEARPEMWPQCRGIQFYNNVDNDFYTSSTGDVAAKCAGKLFLNHNNAGLNDNLKRFIVASFPHKSRFER